MGRSAKDDEAAEAARLHRSVDVPQANRLENVRQLAAAARDGIHHPAALQELLDVDTRHFAYYRQAATILGVVADDDAGALALTDSGRRLLATRERSDEERNFLRQLIVSARALRPFSSFFQGEPSTTDEIAHRLGVLSGLAHTTALRRAQTLFQWRKYIDGASHEAGNTTATLPDIAPEIEAQVARHNALAKQIWLDRLLRLSPTEFEHSIARLVSAMGFSNVTVTGGAGDGGVDVTATKMDDWGKPVMHVVQVKRYRKPVGRRVIDELGGVLHRERYPHGILVTTSDFSSQALEAAKGVSNLRLVNGAELVGLMLKHGVGLRAGRYGEIQFE
jgi:restriction endonuclease Mrr